MSIDITLDDWAFPASIDVRRNKQTEYDVDKNKLDKNIQQNREIITRMRNNKKYEKILQKV